MGRSLAAAPSSYLHGRRILDAFGRDAHPALFHLQYKREQVLFHVAVTARARPVDRTGNAAAFRQWRAIAPLYRRAAMSTAGIICVSEEVADDISALVGRRCPPLHVVENSVDLAKFALPTPEERRRARERFGIGDHAVVVATVCRIAASKRVALALDAVNRLPGGLALICGDGPERAELERRRAGPRAIFTGFLFEPREAYLAADVLVHPSSGDGEGWPLTLVEAAASGLPVVVCDDTRFHRIVRGWGRAVSPTGESIARAVATVDEWRAPGAARTWAEERSTERAVEKHLSIMRALRDTPR